MKKTEKLYGVWMLLLPLLGVFSLLDVIDTDTVDELWRAWWVISVAFFWIFYFKMWTKEGKDKAVLVPAIAAGIAFTWIMLKIGGVI